MSDCSTEVGFCPCLPSDSVLRSGAVIFPGVCDQLGSALVFFPAEFQEKLLCVTKQEVVEFVCYCLRLHRSRVVDASVSVVADLRAASLTVTRRLAEILLLLQRSVHTFYAVQPKKRDGQKLLQNLLSSSKCSPQMKCVFLREVLELRKFVDCSQLTSDLGGYFVYSHESWSSFIREMDRFLQEFVCVVRRLPVFLSALQDFSKLSLPVEFQSLSIFCSTNQMRLQRLRSDLGLDVLLRRCEELLEKFRYPERDPSYQDMMGTVLFTHTALEMLQNYERIQAAVEKVELLWRRVFSGAHLRLHVLQLQRDSQQVMCEMEFVIQKLHSCTPETLRDANTAEALQLEFNTSVHTHTAELVRRAEDVLKAASETVPLARSHKEHAWMNDLEMQKNRLQAVMALQKRNLTTICSFHHCYHRIQRWYHAAVCENLLQDLLWRTCSSHFDQEEPLLPHKQTEVFSGIEAFLRLRPPPEVGELMQLAHLANVVPDAQLEKAGKQLAKRCSSLRRLLISPGSVTFQVLRLALHWQYEYLKGRRADSSSDLHTLRTVCDQSMVRDPEFSSHSVNTNMMTRHNGGTCPLLLQPGNKPPSLSSFDSGFEGAGSGHLETGSGKMCHKTSRPKSSLLLVNQENVSSISEGPEKFLQAPSIHIIPNASGDSVNFEITVKRSATLPKNPWLSLPVDDLESCYTVIISPSWQKETLSCDQLTQTAEQSVCDFQDQNAEWSSITNVLSSTITDEGPGAERSDTMPTLLWDSYDLHESDGMSLCDPDSEWVLKEQQELRAVEERLNRTAGILQEEESILAQEKTLDVLLEADSPYRMWSSWNKACEFSQMTSSDLAEAGVIGLEDELASLHFGHSDNLSQESPSVPHRGSDTPSEPGTGGPDSSVILKEIENLKVFEEKINDENLNIEALHCCESKEKISALSLREDRMRFHEELGQEKKEVEEIERDLSREMKRKLKGPSRSHKIVRCSVLGKGLVLKEDEALLMNCRSSAQDAPGFNQGQPCLAESPNRQPSDMAADHHVCQKSSDPEGSVHSKCSADSSASDFMNISLNSPEQRNSDFSGSSVSAAGSSVQTGGDFGCDVETEITDLLSSVMNTSAAQGSAPEELNILVDLPDPSETSNPGVENSTSEEVSSPAFDPAGQSLLPGPSRQDKKMSIDSEGNLYDAIDAISISNPQECRRPSSRTSAVELINQNINNNDLNLLDLSDGLENMPEEPEWSEFVFRPEDQKPDACCEDLISGTQSLLLETSAPHGAMENAEVEVEVNHVDASTRCVCGSPVIQQLQICTQEMSDFLTPVVLDTGSSLVKAGFADQDLPTTIFPTAVGLPKYMEVMTGSVQRSVFVGHDAQHMRGVLTLHYPMRSGVVSDWQQMEMIWTHAFEQLRVCSEDHPVLLTEGAMSTQENRQRSIQVMFESFNVPLTYTVLQPVLALYTTGRTTGVVFDSGDGASHSVPVFDGYCLPHAIQRFHLAGNDVTLHLKQLLMEQGVCMRTSAELEIVREMKESCCCVALNYEAELNGGGGARAPVHYTLPDGQVVSVTTERFRAPEILFRPELIGRDYYGMQESVFRSVLRSDVDLRMDLVGNIVLSGGNTLLCGLPERLQREIIGLAPACLGECVKVTSPGDREFSVWRGGAVLASMPTFSSAWISQQEYEEFGPQIVFRKCF